MLDDSRAAVAGAVRDWCAGLTTREITDKCAKGVPATAVNTFEKASQHKHVIAGHMLQHVELSDGQTAFVTGPAVEFSRTRTKVRNAAPVKGQNNEHILRSLGYSSEQIAEPADHGVI